MKEVIRKILTEFSIEAFGFCKFKMIEPYLIECRGKTRLPSNAQSVITMLFPYYVDIENHNISRYAVIPDYHLICEDILNKASAGLSEAFSNFKFVSFIDNSPIPEVRCAVLSGLGCLGDNGLLINKKYGSWVFIGEIVTDMEISSDLFHNECLHCGKCVNSCPGKALSKTFFDRSHCISHINQKKGDLSGEEIELLKKGDCLWGCDICQEVCPLNKNICSTNIREFYSGIVSNIDKESYNNLKDRAFQWRPKSVLERNLDIVKREDNFLK